MKIYCINFVPQICLLADALGSLLAYDALAPFSSSLTRHGSRYGSHESMESSAMGPVTNSTKGTNISSDKMRELSLSDPHIISDQSGGGRGVGTEARGGSLPISSSPSHHNTAPSAASSSPSSPHIPQAGAPGRGLACSSRSERSKSEVGIPDVAMIGHSAPPSGFQYSSRGVVDDAVPGQGQTLPSGPRQHHLSCDGGGRTGDWRDKDNMRRTSSGSHYEGGIAKFDFEVTDVFMCGAPLGMVLAYRRAQKLQENSGL